VSFLFPRLYDPVMLPLERRQFKNVRKNLIAKADGKVLEIGSGTGINFPYYHPDAEIVAFDPNPTMLKKSLPKIKQSTATITLLFIEGDHLPFPDNSFDTVVGTLVFCTIPEPEKTLSEIHRVLKPGGKVLLFEHVRLDDPTLGKMQDWLTPVWKKVCDGCHLNRNTLQQVKQAGFHVDYVESYAKNLFLTIELSH
jgi:ubiquinone/menaquinone biosynthesis C-methylase UbiE